MDTSLLSLHCIELLRTNNRVSLGNMGSFMAEDTPATLTHNAHVLLPPGRRIFFRESETWNDGLLEKAYDNPEELKTLLSEVSRKLTREKSVTLEGFGRLRRTREGDVFFVMDKSVSVNPNEFGLVPLSMSPLSTPSKVKCTLSDPLQEDTREEKQETESKGGTKTTAGEVKTDRKASKGVAVFLTILLLLILCLLLVYVFKDFLRPVLEKILYSAEERLLL
ncbi:MAG: hypothetical protein GX877_03195 [Bacteroidales bacterium]|nr:hypothetical protein [Bacteroidales bacterium]